MRHERLKKFGNLNYMNKYDLVYFFLLYNCIKLFSRNINNFTISYKTIFCLRNLKIFYFFQNDALNIDHEAFFNVVR